MIQTIVGDCLESLRTLPSDSVHCCVTSPPYFGLRDYGVDGQIGLEPSPAEFVAKLVDVFREVRRVLHPSGTCWVNMGDSYANDGKWGGHTGGKHVKALHCSPIGRNKRYTALKPKDLIGVPWLLAFALRDDGWYLRQDIIWHKPAPMPESVTDRCTKAHEYVFMFSKRPRYFYDQEAIKEPSSTLDCRRPYTSEGAKQLDGRQEWKSGMPRDGDNFATRNRRSVWTVAPEPFPDAHFATYPAELIRPMIRAGTSERGCCPACLAPWERVTERQKLKRARPNDITKRNGENGTGNHCGNTVAGVAVKTRGWCPTCECNAGDPIPCTVLDPFAGSGTTGMVAKQEGRACILLELNPVYAAMHRHRVNQIRPMNDADAPLFAEAQ